MKKWDNCGRSSVHFKMAAPFLHTSDQRQHSVFFKILRYPMVSGRLWKNSSHDPLLFGHFWSPWGSGIKEIALFWPLHLQGTAHFGQKSGIFGFFLCNFQGHDLNFQWPLRCEKMADCIYFFLLQDHIFIMFSENKLLFPQVIHRKVKKCSNQVWGATYLWNVILTVVCYLKRHVKNHFC